MKGLKLAGIEHGTSSVVTSYSPCCSLNILTPSYGDRSSSSSSPLSTEHLIHNSFKFSDEYLGFDFELVLNNFPLDTFSEQLLGMLENVVL